jgi:hypothetical protein
MSSSSAITTDQTNSTDSGRDDPRRFDDTRQELLARLDSFELEILVKLTNFQRDNTAAIEQLRQSLNPPLPPLKAKLSVAEIVRIVLATAVITTAVFVPYVLLLLR